MRRVVPFLRNVIPKVNKCRQQNFTPSMPLPLTKRYYCTSKEENSKNEETLPVPWGKPYRVRMEIYDEKHRYEGIFDYETKDPELLAVIKEELGKSTRIPYIVPLIQFNDVAIQYNSGETIHLFFMPSGEHSPEESMRLGKWAKCVKRLAGSHSWYGITDRLWVALSDMAKKAIDHYESLSAKKI